MMLMMKSLQAFFFPFSVMSREFSTSNLASLVCYTAFNRQNFIWSLNNSVVIHLSSPRHDLFCSEIWCHWKRRNSNISPRISDYHSETHSTVLKTKPEDRRDQSRLSYGTVSLVCFYWSPYYLCVVCQRSELQNFREPEIEAAALEKHHRAWTHWEIASQVAVLGLPVKCDELCDINQNDICVEC